MESSKEKRDPHSNVSLKNISTLNMSILWFFSPFYSLFSSMGKINFSHCPLVFQIAIDMDRLIGNQSEVKCCLILTHKGTYTVGNIVNSKNKIGLVIVCL